MNRRRSARLYRGLLRCYPKSFRDQYGDDMLLLFTDQLHDEPALRVWARGVVDLAITVPSRYLEAHMKHPPRNLVPSLFAGLSVTLALAGLVLGSSVGGLMLGLLLAAAAGSVAVASYRVTRPIGTDRPASAHWWKFVVGGAAAIAAFAVITSTTGDLKDPWWWPMMVCLLAALGLLATGIILGIARLSARRPHNAATGRPA